MIQFANFINNENCLLIRKSIVRIKEVSTYVHVRNRVSFFSGRNFKIRRIMSQLQRNCRRVLYYETLVPADPSCYCCTRMFRLEYKIHTQIFPSSVNFIMFSYAALRSEYYADYFIIKSSEYNSCLSVFLWYLVDQNLRNAAEDYSFYSRCSNIT